MTTFEMALDAALVTVAKLVIAIGICAFALLLASAFVSIGRDPEEQKRA